MKNLPFRFSNSNPETSPTYPDRVCFSFFNKFQMFKKIWKEPDTLSIKLTCMGHC